MQKKGLLFTVVVLLVFTAFSQHPLKHFADAVEMRFDNKQPVVHYILTVDSADLSSLTLNNSNSLIINYSVLDLAHYGL